MVLGYRHPVGPLRTTDLVGLDVRLGIAEYLASTLSERFAPPQILIDKVQRGELISRVTNDIDNITQTMQQSLSSVVTSVLTVIGVLASQLWGVPYVLTIHSLEPSRWPTCARSASTLSTSIMRRLPLAPVSRRRTSVPA